MRYTDWPLVLEPFGFLTFVCRSVDHGFIMSIDLFHTTHPVRIAEALNAHVILQLVPYMRALAAGLANHDSAALEPPSAWAIRKLDTCSEQVKLACELHDQLAVIVKVAGMPTQDANSVGKMAGAAGHFEKPDLNQFGGEYLCSVRFGEVSSQCDVERSGPNGGQPDAGDLQCDGQLCEAPGCGARASG